MDEESLLTILESIFDDIQTNSSGLLKVDGLELTKVEDNVYSTNIVFYFVTDDPDITEEEKKMLEINYKFDLATMTDEEIFQAIHESIEAVRAEIAQLLISIANTVRNSIVNDCSKDYIR